MGAVDFVVRDLGAGFAHPELRYQADYWRDGVVVRSYGGPTPEAARHNGQMHVLMTESDVTSEAHARFIMALKEARGYREEDFLAAKKAIRESPWCRGEGAAGWQARRVTRDDVDMGHVQPRLTKEQVEEIVERHRPDARRERP